MQKRKAVVAGLLAASFLAASISTADAAWFRGHREYYHRGPGPVLGLVGAIVVGAATIATAPFAIIAGAGRSEPPPPDYYGPPPGYGPPAYGPPAYGPPAYGPPPAYYYGRGPGYYGPPRGYYGY